MARKMRDANHKSQLEDMTSAWEMLADARRRQLLRSAQRRQVMAAVEKARRKIATVSTVTKTPLRAILTAVRLAWQRRPWQRLREAARRMTPVTVGSVAGVACIVADALLNLRGP